MEVTQPAADELKEVFAADDNQTNSMLRIQIEGYGWGGPKFRLTLDELKGENDKVIESNGLSVIYDKNIQDYLDNMILDYEETAYSRGFTIKGVPSSSC